MTNPSSLNPLSLWLSSGCKVTALEKKINKTDEDMNNLLNEQMEYNRRVDLRIIELEGRRQTLCKQQDYINALNIKTEEL